MTDIQYAVKTINFIYDYFLDNCKLDINSYEWEKIKNKNPQLLKYLDGNKQVGKYHEQFVNEFGFLTEPTFMQEEFVSQSESVLQFVMKILPLGRLLKFAQDENFNQVEKYFKNKKEGSVFHLMPVQSETGLVIDYQSLTLRDAIEHEAVLICQKQ